MSRESDTGFPFTRESTMPQKRKSTRRSGLKDLKPSKVNAAKSSQVRGGAPSTTDLPVVKLIDKSSPKLYL